MAHKPGKAHTGNYELSGSGAAAASTGSGDSPKHSSAAHKSLKPLAQFAPVAAPAPAAHKKKTTNNKPKGMCTRSCGRALCFAMV